MCGELIILSISLHLTRSQAEEGLNRSPSPTVLCLSVVLKFGYTMESWGRGVKKYWCLRPSSFCYSGPEMPPGDQELEELHRWSECTFKFENAAHLILKASLGNCSAKHRGVLLTPLSPRSSQVSPFFIPLPWFKPHHFCSRSLPPISVQSSGVLFLQSVTILLRDKFLSS